MATTNKLTDKKITSLKELGKYFDGEGLYLELTGPGRGYWRLKYRFDGKEKRMAFGVYPTVTLKVARERRDAARAILASGKDPMQAERDERAAKQRAEALTFERVARQWLEHKRSGWSERTAGLIGTALASKVFPTIGARPICEIKPYEVRDVVRKVEDDGQPETAGRVLQRIKAVFGYAVVHDLIEFNPMAELRPMELLKSRQVKHRAAIGEAALPEFLRRLAAYQGAPATVAALRLLMLTAVRPGELRAAQWQEFDLDKAEWLIPAEHMKMKLAHTVPLPKQAVELLRSLPGERKAASLLFPSPFYPDKQMSENTLNSALRRMGYKGEHTAHGFRALFSTVANERGRNSGAIERQLAHVVPNQSERAYNRAALLEERRVLMQWYADFLDRQAAAGAEQ